MTCLYSRKSAFIQRYEWTDQNSAEIRYLPRRSLSCGLDYNLPQGWVFCCAWSSLKVIYSEFCTCRCTFPFWIMWQGVISAGGVQGWPPWGGHSHFQPGSALAKDQYVIPVLSDGNKLCIGSLCVFRCLIIKQWSRMVQGLVSTGHGAEVR